MTIAADVAPDVEVDESELTQQPCGIGLPVGHERWSRCDKPAVGEVMATCSCNHTRSQPCCEQHLSRFTIGTTRCALCNPGHRCLVTQLASRYYTRRAS